MNATDLRDLVEGRTRRLVVGALDIRIHSGVAVVHWEQDKAHQYEPLAEFLQRRECET